MRIKLAAAAKIQIELRIQLFRWKVGYDRIYLKYGQEFLIAVNMFLSRTVFKFRFGSYEIRWNRDFCDFVTAQMRMEATNDNDFRRILLVYKLSIECCSYTKSL